MHLGSAECVALEDIAKSIPAVETDSSRQGQTYHTADGVSSRTRAKRL